MNRCLLIACIALSFVMPARAQDPKPNTLTPKEVAEGWIHLFDGETTFGWKVQGPSRLENGEWLIGGDNDASIETTSHFDDGEWEIDARRMAKEDKLELIVGGLRARFLVTKQSFTVKNGQKFNFEIRGGKSTKISTLPRALKLDSFRFVVPAGSQLAFRSIKFKPAATQSLFNGKDLTGWHIFPGKKSTFSVIDGAINIKDGPGDLQTEKKFGDFLLQFECISNGPHLNSGVFFRCRPNEYQNGYEAQVRNQFTEKTTQKYLLEEYDPQTHKLIAKKESQFTAVDFGTGAIYRRQPARKEMSKDKEWFTMTVVAHGNHIATWVNGVQVTDWYDNRPPSDNARTGYRSEAGHLSLQGHDPTTDLSFRNFRIQEYPSAK